MPDPTLEDTIRDERAQRLARRRDPATSAAAAARAARWAMSHEERIVGVLFLPGNAYDIARRTGLTYVQVDRRIGALIEAGRVRVLDYTKPSPTGDPCRVYDQVMLK